MKLSRQLSYIRRHERGGLCRLCSNKVFNNTTFCLPHLKSNRVRKRKEKGFKPWRKGGRGRPPKS